VQAEDESGDPLTDPVTGAEITEITWDDEDALPFPLCISSRTDREHGETFVDNVSVARGNIVLVDHGLTLEPEDLGRVPEPKVFLPRTGSACSREDPVAVPPRYRPTLSHGPVTQVAPLECGVPASRTLDSQPGDALPAVRLVDSDGIDWWPRRDLLSSEDTDFFFVTEIEEDGTASLRFGDNQHGARPGIGTGFDATYRAGNGVRGNVGREAIKHIVSSEGAITAVRNLLPARGGINPESMEDVRQRAPSAFRTQERAVTEADYAEVAQRFPGIQRAAATFRWTGSWHTVFLTIDRFAGVRVDADFERIVREFVERFRMAGYDLEADAPRYVSLQITMQVCVNPAYFRSDVKDALLEVFSNRTLPDGRRGVFHPDNFTFGQPVFLSRLYAAAQDVPGVDSVEIVDFGRMGVTDPKPLQDGELLLNRLEIARLDNDPNFPEHGVFTLTVMGGK
jgi:Baseplate J-like protein